MLANRIIGLFYNQAKDKLTILSFIILSIICCFVVISCIALGFYGIGLMFGWLFNETGFVLNTFIKGIVYCSIAGGVFFGIGAWFCDN